MNWDDDLLGWAEFRRLDKLLSEKDPLRRGPSLGDMLLSQSGQVAVREMVREVSFDSRISPPDALPQHRNGSGILTLFGVVLLRFVNLVQWIGWLIWRVGALAWILPYWFWFGLVLRLRFSSSSSSFLPHCAILVVLLFVLLLDYSSSTRDLEIRSRPGMFVGWTWSWTRDCKGHDVQQRRCQHLYLLAAPFLCRTVLDGLRAGHAACVRLFSNAFDVQISLSEHVVLCFHPTPPGAVGDRAYRRQMLDDELRRRDVTMGLNVDDAASDLIRRTAEETVELCPCAHDSTRLSCEYKGRLYFNEEKYAAAAAARRRHNQIDETRRPVSRVFIGPRFARESMPIVWGVGKGSRFVPRMMKVWVYHDCATQM
ncbi:hypothetical protein E4U21_000819 [Claviceps maximensis]|nr:hypothetical protein E4U21_000819 [Claviceps maximensis]